MKTLLVIFAHPDDESHGPAGTLAKYAREGVQVHYLCATRGEAGMVDSTLLKHGGSVADLRTDEVQQAAAELQLASVNFLGYRDSGMQGSADNQHPDSLYQALLNEVAARIASFIQRLRPDAIITHDQYGWYGHPDHIKVYLATLKAYELLYGRSPEALQNLPLSTTIPRLYISSFSKRLLKIVVRLMPLLGRDPRRHGQNQDVDLVRIASWNVPTTARINVGSYLPIKDRAIACHASQRPLADTKNKLLRHLMRWFESSECYGRVYPPVVRGEAVETSLFERIGKNAQHHWPKHWFTGQVQGADMS
jgi:N-acetyl-1-D-myo-inositol-2-amino-2-deoxy-alpha-D-glucopyranoside deacetylase